MIKGCVYRISMTRSDLKKKRLDGNDVFNNYLIELFFCIQQRNRYRQICLVVHASKKQVNNLVKKQTFLLSVRK